MCQISHFIFSPNGGNHSFFLTEEKFTYNKFFKVNNLMSYDKYIQHSNHMSKNIKKNSYHPRKYFGIGLQSINVPINSHFFKKL